MQVGWVRRTCNVIPGDAGPCQCSPKVFLSDQIIRSHEVLRFLPIFIPYPTSKSQEIIVVTIEKRRMRRDERGVCTSFQQTLDKKLSAIRIFRFHGQMQWCIPLDPIDWVYVALLMAENVLYHTEGYMRDSSVGLSSVVRYRTSSAGVSRVVQG